VTGDAEEPAGTGRVEPARPVGGGIEHARAALALAAVLHDEAAAFEAPAEGCRPGSTETRVVGRWRENAPGRRSVQRPAPDAEIFARAAMDAVLPDGPGGAVQRRAADDVARDAERPEAADPAIDRPQLRAPLIVRDDQDEPPERPRRRRLRGQVDEPAALAPDAEPQPLPHQGPRVVETRVQREPGVRDRAGGRGHVGCRDRRTPGRVGARRRLPRPVCGTRRGRRQDACREHRREGRTETDQPSSLHR
jgi:hypothetical protein